MTDEPALPLGYVAQRNPPRRPSLRDPAVRRAAAEDILDDIIDWYGTHWREAEREEVIADLMAIAPESDGYRAARALEQRSHWECNAELVDILDGDWSWSAVGRAVRDWIKYNGITPTFKVGNTVKTRHGVGAIVAINADEATYTVQTDQFLAKSPGQAGKTGGYVIAFEAVEAVP